MIMINPGHDSSIGSNGMPVDSGAVNTEYEVYECDIVMNIGMMVADYLKDAGGYDVYVMQQDNLCGEQSYSYRYSVVGQTNLNKMDYFVSIHTNSFSNPGAKGFEILVYDRESEAYDLAKCIQRQVLDAFDGELEDRGVRIRRDLAVLSKTSCPAVLVETAFISNEHDVQLLMNEQEEFAAAIARGITDYVATLE